MSEVREDRAGASSRASQVAAGVSPWLVAALLVAVAALLLGYFRPLVPSPLHDPDAKPRLVTARGDLAGDEQATIELFHAARDAVVHITTVAYQGDSSNWNPLLIPQGTGTGFIWDEVGHVVTNFHVIERAEGARIRLFDGSTFDAEFVGGAPEQDIAVLRIKAPEGVLDPILIGKSADLQVGTFAE